MPTQTGVSDGAIIGIDIGGTKTKAIAFDHSFRPLAEYRVATITGGVEPVAAAVLDTVDKLKARLGDNSIDIVGVGIPGLVDPSAGSVRQAVNLGIGDEPLDLARRIAAAHGVPCHIDNDVNVAALGAFELLRHEYDITDLAYLSIGTGIAAGIILNGRLHRGHRGVAGEIGHFPMLPGGPQCECGLTGCLEAVASGSAIGRQWPASANANSAEALIIEANAGNTEAIATLEPITDHLAKAIYLLALAYDVDRVIIGGGVAELGHLLLDSINDALLRLETQSDFVRSLGLCSRIMLKPPGAVGATGAAVLTQINKHS